jgi:hypothetical protein
MDRPTSTRRRRGRAGPVGLVVLVAALMAVPSGACLAGLPAGRTGTAPASLSPRAGPSVPVATNGTAYYVDFAHGSDRNAGTTPTTAWQHAPGDPAATGTPANVTLLPGDSVHFKGGVVYNGTVVLTFSGEPGRPITYDGNLNGTYGTGRAILDGRGRALGPRADQYGFQGGETWNGVTDVGVSYVTIAGFEVRDLRYIWNDTGGGWNNGPQGIAIGGVGSNVTVENCWVHDVQPIAVAVNPNSEVMGALHPWTSVRVTNSSFTDANVSLASYAGTVGSLARFKIYVGWGSDDYTIASAYLGPYSATNNSLRVYQDLNLTMPGWNTANSNPVGAASAYGYSIFNMTSGPMYGKESADLAVADHTGVRLLNNTLADAGTGIDLSLDNGSLLEGNDISNVSWGIAGGSGEVAAAALVNVTIAFNHLHDFYPYVKYGYWSGWHGDGVYLFAGSNSYAPIENLLLEGNVYTGYIPESTALFYCEDADYENVTVYDNVFAATGSWMIRISADPGSLLDRVRVFNNDFVMAPLDQTPAILFQGDVTNVSLRNNIVWVPSGWGAVFSFDPVGLAPAGSDYNLLGSDYAYAGDIGYNGTEWTLAQWVGSNFSFPHDTHSEIDADPRFANFPDFESYLSGGTLSNVTLEVEDPPVNPHVNATFRIGDRVEYDDDGVVRTVTATGAGAPQPWVAFSPALASPPSLGDFLTDWGNDTNFTFDLRLAADSPARGAGINLAGEVPLVDAAGAARPASGPWDLGAYVFAPAPGVVLTGLQVAPSSASVPVGSNQSFSAVAVCSGACPAGATFRWSLEGGLGTLNATAGSLVTFRAGATAGPDTLLVNASLHGVQRSVAVDISVVASAPAPSAGAVPAVVWLLLASGLVAAVAAGVLLRRRRRGRPPAPTPSP